MQKGWILLFCNLLIVFLVPVFSSIETEYTYNDAEDWAKLYKTCGEGVQAPINLKKSEATPMENVILNFKNYDQTPPNSSLTNTGDTVVFTYMYEKNTPTIESDFLGGTFVLDKAVYHWGTNNNDGSEHAVEGKKYAGELVFLSYDSSFSSYDDAYQKNGRIVAISYFLEAEEMSNGPMGKINLFFEETVEIGSTYYLGKDSLTRPTGWDISLQEFYTYISSSTRPPCRQNIFRIIRERPMKFPANVFTVLQKTKLRGGAKSNVRPLQSSGAQVSYVTNKEAVPK